MSLRRCHAADLFKISSRTITDEGYLIAPAVLARSGNVQTYGSRELGFDGPDRPIRMYRPKEEVLAEDSYKTFDGKPITFKHPKDGVNATNWRSVAVGAVRDVRPAGDDMGATVIVYDAAAVKAVLDGKSALSNGYDFDFDPTPGQAPDGTAYDAVQRRVRGNHTAIVDTARGGPACRIGDHEQQERQMKKITVDGFAIELEDTQAAIVERVVADANKRAKDAADALTAADKAVSDGAAALKAAIDGAAKAATDHAAALKAATDQILKPEQIEALVVERVKVIGDAAKLQPDLKPEGKTVAQIRAEVVSHVIAKDEVLKPIALAALKGADITKAESAPAIGIAFDVIAAAKGAATVEDSATREVNRVLAGNGGNADTATKPRGRDAFKHNLKSVPASEESTAE